MDMALEVLGETFVIFGIRLASFSNFASSRGLKTCNVRSTSVGRM